MDKCWREIPCHFEGTNVDVYGIVEIRGGTLTRPLQETMDEKFGQPQPMSLSTILGSFKSSVTKQVHEQGLAEEKSIWQSRFHDHVIRDDIDHFFIP